MKKRLVFAAVLAVLALAGCKEKSKPSVSFSMENTGSIYEVGELPDFDSLSELQTLPNPFKMMDGSLVERQDQWEKRRAELMEMFQTYEIGPKFKTPKSCVSAKFIDSEVDTIVVTVEVDGETLSFNCPAYIPQGKGPFPAVIGVGYEAKAGNLPDDIFTSRKIAMIGFPYEEIIQSQQRRGMQPINDLYPEHLEIGSLAGWIWGVSRLIDAIEQLREEAKIDVSHLAVSGCSIGGKLALYTGAFDERIALTISQDAGAGGAASWRVLEHIVETERLGAVDSHWFLRKMKMFEADNVYKLPMDHHELCALIAPRALLVFGNTDYWFMGDEAAYVSLYAARKVWEKFGKEDRIGWSFQGDHPLCSITDDQRADLEAFVDKFLLGKIVETDVRKGENYKYVNVERWCEW